MDAPLLVVSAVEHDAARVQQLQRKQRQRDLNPAVAAVDEISIEEKGARGRREAVCAEEVHQVLKLAVEVWRSGARSGAEGGMRGGVGASRRAGEAE